MKGSSRTRYRRRARGVLIALCTALLLATQALWAGASPRAQSAGDTSVRFEGYIRSQGPSKWVVSSELDGLQIFSVSPTTAIISKENATAELGAWVVVFATKHSSGELDAYLIEVVRPASAPGFPIQFAASIAKLGDRWWLFGSTPVEIPVEVPPEARIVGTPRVGVLAWVSALMSASGLRADWIRVLADAKTVEFVGIVQEINDHALVIDRRTVLTTDETEFLGEVQVGVTVECRALQADDGTLVATHIRVVPSSPPARFAGTLISIRPEDGGSPGTTWTVVRDPLDGTSDPTIVTVQVNGNTWVDETRAVLKPRQWVEVSGAALGQETYQADVVRVERGAGVGPTSLPGAVSPAGVSAATWSTAECITPGLTSAERPSIAFTSDGVMHAVWEADNRVKYARMAPGASWSAPTEIAYGFAPHMISDGQNLHVAFVNRFMGNYDPFYITLTGSSWSLPVNMAYTSGYSTQPRLALSRDHRLLAVWMDNTPGYWTTYYATWDGRFWSNRPIPSGRGQAPSIATASDGTIYVVWQDLVARDEMSLGDFEVFLSELHGDTWATPLDISDSPYINSLAPDVTTTADSAAHVVWVDDESTVRYSSGQGERWSLPSQVASTAGYAHRPRIIAENGSYLHIAWDEEIVLRATSALQGTQSWPQGHFLVFDGSIGLRDIALAPMPAGGAGLSWTQAPDQGASSVWVSLRAPAFGFHLWLPLVIRQP